MNIIKTQKIPKLTFDRAWHYQWFTSGGMLKREAMRFSSNNIKSLFTLTSMAINGMQLFVASEK